MASQPSLPNPYRDDWRRGWKLANRLAMEKQITRVLVMGTIGHVGNHGDHSSYHPLRPVEDIQGC